MVRADAQRNRDELVRVARDAFAAGDPAVSLERIARDAGVGIGTLYRHFATREALVEAVYRSELDEVCDAAPQLIASEADGAAALRAWMDRYARFVGTKHGMAESLRAILESGAIEPGSTRSRVTEALGLLLDAGARDGSLRPGIDPADVAASLVGIFLATRGGLAAPRDLGAAALAQVQRMLDLLFAGIRAPDGR